MARFADVFKLDRKGFRWGRAVVAVAMLLIVLVVLIALDQERYALSVIFGALFVGLSDPGGDYGYRAAAMALVGVVGAVLTFWGYALGDEGWGLVVASVFVVTLAAGLSMKFGSHRFLAALLLNVWFLIALAEPVNSALDGVKVDAWSQTVAWLAGSALWIAVTFASWLIQGRVTRPQPIAELPGDKTTTTLTRPMILFAVIRAVAVAAATAIAFGFHSPNADWMPIATLVAMKGTLQQSALVAGQRLAGAIVGALVAAVFLLSVDNKHALAVIVIVLGGLAVAIRFASYAWYCAAIAGAVLIGMDVSNPTNLADEGRRVLFTLIGVAIAVLVMYLANVIQKRAAASRPRTPAVAS